jgi:hypothetical protein
MKVFWHQGGLHIEPESDRERSALVTLTENMKLYEPPRTIQRANSGSGQLGSDLLEVLGCHDVGVRPIPGDLNDKNPVVGVRIGPQIVAKLDRCPRRG